MTTTDTKPKQITVHASELKRYDPKQHTLIPLFRYTDQSRTKKGKVRKDGKRPLDVNWSSAKYDSAKVLERCIAENRNVGVRLPDDIVVIDVDPRNGGEEGMEQLVYDLDLDTDAWPCVITGSGGRHYYLRKPPSVPILDTLKAYPGVEFKSKGRQVVAAGSIHPETLAHYEFDPLAPPLEEMKDAPKNLIRIIKRPKRNSAVTGGGQYTQEQIARALSGLDVLEFKEHDKWLRCMMACHHASNGDARDEFIEWSTQDPDYEDAAELIGRRWDSLHTQKNDGITYQTLNHFLAEAGKTNLQAANPEASNDFDNNAVALVPYADEFEGDDSHGELVTVEARGLKINNRNVAADTYENAVCAIYKSGLKPEWNELAQNVVFRQQHLPWDDSYGRVLTDHVARLIRMYLVNHFQGVAYSSSKENLHEALMTLAYGAKFNPVLEYVDGLKWDGVKRVERLFADYFHCGDDAYTRAVSLCFMIGAVRRMRHPGSKFDTMPVLRSPQGWNKSTAIKTLFGPDWYSDADLGDLRNKDAAMKLRDIWVQEFAEIESLTRAETGSLKAFLSRTSDRQRDPYGRVVENVPRRCVPIATVNEGGYLKDATGGRRFWPLEVAAPIELTRLAADRDQLWAEAAALEAQGASDVLPRELWAVAAERQAEQTSGDPWSDTLRVFLDRREAVAKSRSDDEELPRLPPGRVHTCELFEALEIATADRTKDKAQRLRTVMESVLKWHYRQGVRVVRKSLPGYTREVLGKTV